MLYSKKLSKMHSFSLISWLAIVVVVAHAEPPVSYLGQETSLFSNTQSSKTHYALENTSQQEDSYSASYHHSATHYHSGYINAPTETQVFKHIYVHVPPKEFEEEERIPRVTHQVAAKQKHYKIVFIKSPSAPAVRAPVVPPAPQNEEKTLIYVLHKKPEAQPDIVIPTPAPTAPSKPEVYFIKYKVKKEEAPVNGPTPATDEIKATSGVEPAGDYSAPQSNDINDFISMHISQYKSQLATAQPAVIKEVQPPQIISERHTSVSYGSPSALIDEEDHHHTTGAEPNNQYLAPETTPAPIVVGEVEAQPSFRALRYGTPKRYFIKRRK